MKKGRRRQKGGGVETPELTEDAIDKRGFGTLKETEHEEEKPEGSSEGEQEDADSPDDDKEACAEDEGTPKSPLFADPGRPGQRT